MHKKEHTKTTPEGKRDNFHGDRSQVMPKKQFKLIRTDPLTASLYVGDIGFYPHARNHYRKRDKGVRENILIYCVDGSGTIQIRNTTHQLTANSYFVIPRNEPHVYWASEQTPWSIYWMHFGGEKSNYFEKYYGRVITFETGNSSRLEDRIQLFNEILSALELGFSFENLLFANMNIYSLLASFFFSDTYRSVTGFRGSDPVDQSIIFMQQNISKMLKMKDIADHVKLSESHISRIFRNKTGDAPIEYFINLKMQEAIRLLTNQSLKIKETAFRLGYEDPYYFTRIFTKYIGSSPGTFVKTTKRSKKRSV